MIIIPHRPSHVFPGQRSEITPLKCATFASDDAGVWDFASQLQRRPQFRTVFLHACLTWLNLSKSPEGKKTFSLLDQNLLITHFTYWQNSYSWHLTSICNSRLATDSSMASGIFTNDTEDKRLVLTCESMGEPCMWSNLKSGALTWSCRTTCDNRVLKYVLKKSHHSLQNVSLTKSVGARRICLYMKLRERSHLQILNRLLDDFWARCWIAQMSQSRNLSSD